MANKNQSDILLSGGDKGYFWKRQNPGVHIDFTRKNPVLGNLIKADFHGVNLPEIGIDQPENVVAIK